MFGKKIDAIIMVYFILLAFITVIWDLLGFGTINLRYNALIVMSSLSLGLNFYLMLKLYEIKEEVNKCVQE